MRILITGGAGMIGSHCAEHFARGGRNKVIVYDNLMRSKIFASKKKSVEYNWHYLHQYKNIDFWKNDIRDISSLKKCFKKYKPDVVIHAAAQPGVRFSLENPQEDFSINCAGTLNVLDMLRSFNPKGTLIYCSTNKVYGENVNNIPLKETKTRYAFKNGNGVSETLTVDHAGHTPYGVSKLSGDFYTQDFAHTYGIKTGIFRMSCIYGTRQFGFEDQGWIAWFAICYLLGDKITIYGNGKQVRDVLWVDDLIEAYDSFIKSPLKYGVFNMGGGGKKTLSLLELLAILEDITGKKVKVAFKEWRRFDQKVYISDIAKVQKALGWKPAVTPREGVLRIVRWVQENRELF
ncbi:MAG: NAD-dependent epimerase/dehydratase family protein [Candidatus Omnitrophica bacterium]|nr:NAD-dependent epimerase/dehydratase family protein [Candidatus Omnitrophota bacterium]